MENYSAVKLQSYNPLIGFKCNHYSVTESAGHVEVTIIKKNANQECTFGIKTCEGTAKQGTEYEHLDEVVTMRKKENSKILQIKIFDNNDW